MSVWILETIRGETGEQWRQSWACGETVRPAALKVSQSSVRSDLLHNCFCHHWKCLPGETVWNCMSLSQHLNNAVPPPAPPPWWLFIPPWSVAVQNTYKHLCLCTTCRTNWFLALLVICLSSWQFCAFCPRGSTDKANSNVDTGHLLMGAMGHYSSRERLTFC